MKLIDRLHYYLEGRKAQCDGKAEWIGHHSYTGEALETWYLGYRDAKEEGGTYHKHGPTCRPCPLSLFSGKS